MNAGGKSGSGDAVLGDLSRGPVKVLKRRPGLRLITTSLPVVHTRPMNQLGLTFGSELNAKLVKVQAGNKDETGLGW